MERAKEALRAGWIARRQLAESSPQKKWGPALLPAPTAPSEGYAGVRNLVDRTFRTTYPLSILAHQLRRRFPPNRSLHKGGARSIYLTALPEGSLVFRPSRPGIRTEALQPKPPDALRPFLGQSLLRPALLTNPTSTRKIEPGTASR